MMNQDLFKACSAELRSDQSPSGSHRTKCGNTGHDDHSIDRRTNVPFAPAVT